MASFRLFARRYFATKTKIPKKYAMRKDQLMPGIKTEDEKTSCEKTKKKVSNGVFLHNVFSSFRAEISPFRVADFIFSHVDI